MLNPFWILECLTYGSQHNISHRKSGLLLTSFRVYRSRAQCYIFYGFAVWHLARMRKGKLTFIRAKRCLTSSVSSACCQLAATLASKITHLGTWLVPTVLSSQSSEMLRIRKPITNIKPDEVEFRKDKPKDYPKVNANVWKLLVVTFSIFTLLLIITIQSPSSRNFFRSNTEQIASNDPFTRGKLYDAPLLDKDGKLYHLVFSTDCSAYQHWQSYLLFYIDYVPSNQ